MNNLLDRLLPPMEENHQNIEQKAGRDAFYPFYEGLSLINLPASICRWLGAPALGAQPLAHEITDSFQSNYRSVILLVVDGLGLNTLQAALGWANRDQSFSVWTQLAQQATLAPLTSIVPSTTASALTTFWTGSAPAVHGVMGYEMWLKEYGILANMIYQSPASFLGDLGSLRKAGFDPEHFLTIPTLGAHLRKHGVQPHAFQHASIARSGLSMMLMPAVDIHPYRSLSDLWVTLNDQLDGRKGVRSYNYIYWGDLDEHSHRFGPDDPRVALEFAQFSRQLQYFVQKRQKQDQQDTLLIITADHGHISTPRAPQYDLRNHPQLLKMLVMSPSGEARLPYVFLRPGMHHAFRHYLEDTWSGEFIPIAAEEVLQSGLFGPGDAHEMLADRIGDYVVFPQGSAYWWFGSRDNHLLGRHGGLSRTEMLVPFFALTL